MAVGQWLLNRAGCRLARRLVSERPDARIVANGGNCLWPGLNWAHCVHAAWQSTVSSGAPAWFRWKSRIAKRLDQRLERLAFGRARLVLANSNATRRHLIELCGLDEHKVRTVYLGSNDTWGAVTPEERSASRARLGISGHRRIALFVGAMGYEGHKGFDVTIEAFGRLCTDPAWNVDLLAAGGGRALPLLQSRIEATGLTERIRLLGFREDIRELLAAADVLVSPAHYEAYGLNVQESLCRGVPAIASAQAGIAERYPEELRPLLLDDPRDAGQLAATLRRWHAQQDEWKRLSRPFGDQLRSRSWRDMAREIFDIAAAEFAA